MNSVKSDIANLLVIAVQGRNELDITMQPNFNTKIKVMTKQNCMNLHHCIFEINKDTKTYNYVDDFGNDFTAAEEFCQSMNNFRKPNMHVYFCIRCLEQEEFANIENYNPILQIVIKVRKKND